MSHPKGFFTLDALAASLLIFFTLFMASALFLSSTQASHTHNSWLQKSTYLTASANHLVKYAAACQVPFPGGSAVKHHCLSHSSLASAQAQFSKYALSAGFSTLTISTSPPMISSPDQFCARRLFEDSGAPVNMWVCATVIP